MFAFQSTKLHPHGYHRTAPTFSLRHPHHNNPTTSSSAPTPNLHPNRRSLLFLSTTLSLPPPLSTASTTTTTTTTTPSSPPSSPPLDTIITDRVFLDFSICPSYFRTDRAQDQDLPPCPDSQPIGRVVLGLYGKLVPITVSNFKSMCSGASGSSYKNTLVHKIFPGQFMLAGRQGRREKGVVKPPLGLARNIETVDSRAFMLQHSRPGVLSLCLSENDDEEEIKLDPDYHNVEFLITTGPGPCPQLDSKNIIFGSVLEGLDVVTAIASVPIFKPAERIRLFNDFAEFIGDERAQNARTLWNRPLKTIYISDCGEVNVAKPSLSPSLP
ncbi:cytochrome P450 monooxygenase 28 [Ancistrocladus abbreviatus]